MPGPTKQSPHEAASSGVPVHGLHPSFIPRMPRFIRKIPQIIDMGNIGGFIVPRSKRTEVTHALHRTVP